MNVNEFHKQMLNKKKSDTRAQTIYCHFYKV